MSPQARDVSIAERQRQVRERLLAAENLIATELARLEAELGVRIRGIDVTRYESGYKPLVRVA